jgi:hypothetical protein
MKLILTAILMLVAAGCAVLPVNEGGTAYRRSIHVPDGNRDQLFDLSRGWLARQFGISRYPIDYESREDGIIIVSGSIPRPLGIANPLGGGRIAFVLREEIGEHEVRITCDRFTVIDAPEHNLLTGANAGGEYYLRFRGDMDFARCRIAELTDCLARHLRGGPVCSDRQGHPLTDPAPVGGNSPPDGRLPSPLPA